MDAQQVKADIIAGLGANGIQIYYEEKLGIQLRAGSNGWTKKVLCPIHQDQATPNFEVNVNTGGFKCFSCQAQGSIFDFESSVVQGKDRKTGFWDAVHELARRAGLDVREAKKVRSNTGGSAYKLTDRKPTFINETEVADRNHDTIILQSVVDEFTAALTSQHAKYLNQKRGLSLKTIQQERFGFDKDAKVKMAPVEGNEGGWTSGRITFPVLGRKADGAGPDEPYPCRNIRKYSPLATPEAKMVNTQGHGSPIRLLGLHKLLEKNWKHVFICEGEFDYFLGNQLLEEAGIDSEWGFVTSTGGAQSFRPEWIEDLIGRHVYFIYDADEPGKSAVATHLHKYFMDPIRAGRFLSVRHVLLPLPGTKEFKDIGDYFLKENHSIEELLDLAFKTPVVGVTESMIGGEVSHKSIEVQSFVSCVNNREYIDKRVSVPITISGHTSHTYHAPRRYSVTKCDQTECCSSDAGDKVVPLGHDLYIKSCMANKREIYRSLQCMGCSKDLPPKASGPVISIDEKVVMKEYFAHQVVERWRAEENADGRMENCQDLCTIPIYIMQPESGSEIKPQNYIATGWIRSHPNTQQVTMFVEHLESLEDDYKKFDITDPECLANLKEMQKFRPKQILQLLTDEVTRIYKSDDILLSVLLTYLSPLRFVFNGEPLRGWLKIAIIGDSGTGKSKTYEALSDWTGIGDLFSVLSGSRTGLLYAIKQRGGEWYISIGRYVAANRGIIAIDEAQEFEPEDTRKMGIAMDTGFLDINHVASGGYQTEVRTVLLLNPPNGQCISDFPFGVKALAACFSPMFIRRLDLAVFCTGRDDASFYNQRSNALISTETTIKKEWLRALIHWAWTRTVNDIQWMEDATTACLEQTTVLAEKFGAADDVPLVSPQDFRKNLARMATSFAILNCSFTADYSGVVVKQEHVNAMARFVDSLYSSMSCNLIQYSKLNKKRKRIDDFDHIRQNFEQFIERALTSGNDDYATQNYFCQLIVLLQQTDYFRVRDIQEQLGISMSWTRKYINVMHGYNLIEPVRGGYKPTRKFNMFIQKWTTEINPESGTLYSIRNKTIEDMLAEVHKKIGLAAMRSGRDDKLAYESDDGFDTAPEAPY